MSGPYEGIADNEYLDLSGRSMGIVGLKQILQDIGGDAMIRQLDLSYNISADEVANPKALEQFIRAIKVNLTSNKVLTALDLGGNHLFDNKPHPFNEHIKCYIELLINVLLQTSITHLDLSDNCVVGTGREFKGFASLMRRYVLHAVAFKCRFSNLNSLGLKILSSGLGDFSSITFLDISDNLGGMDPHSQHSSEGVVVQKHWLLQCLGRPV